ncbi:MAG: hypothetical protein FGF50_11520 [Candidatus Brockarchaeota archaeon]|nr:hypothetical protein [Candidatus Brockarchaeota archaeon]
MSRKYDKPEIKEKYEPYIEKSFYFKSPEETELKWGIRSSGGFPDVYGDIKGDIFIWLTLAEVSDIIFLSCELDKVRITSEEVDKIWEMSLNRESWSELERKYKRFVRWLKHADEVAKKVTEKTGIKTILHIPHPEEGDRFSLIAMFNPKGMSDEEKMKMIEKAIDAVEEARKGL